MHTVITISGVNMGTLLSVASEEAGRDSAVLWVAPVPCGAVAPEKPQN